MYLVCAILFCSITFVYLYCYQADTLAVTQHILSEGKTHYNSLVGAALITIVLFFLHIGIAYAIKVKPFSYSLTYFPSILLLTVVTDICSNIGEGSSSALWMWLLPLLLILYIGFLLLRRLVPPLSVEDNGNIFFSKTMCINVLSLTVMFFISGLVSDNDDIFHYRAHIERCLENNKFDEALNTAKQSEANDSSLTMLRIFALAKTNSLGERLFEYPITGGSQSLLPNGKGAKLLMYPENNIYAVLGEKPQKGISSMEYLHHILEHKHAERAAADYLLCGYLLDKKLDEFAKNIGKYYDLKGELPKHYREALTLYVHLRSNPNIMYHNTVMDTDYQDYQNMTNKYPNKTIRKNSLRDTYGNTYWYYYQYVNS